MTGQGFAGGLQAASPLLLGIGRDLLAGRRSTGEGVASGVAQTQALAQQRQRSAATDTALASMGFGGASQVAPPQGAAGAIGGARGAAGLMAGAELPQGLRQIVGGMVQAGDKQGAFDLLSKYQLSQATASNDPYDRFKVVGGDLVDLGADGGPSAVYQGRDGGQKPNSAIAKLAEDFRKGFIDRETFDAARAKALSGQQFSVTTAAGDTITYGSGGSALGRRTQGEIETRELDARDSLARLEEIEANLINPEVLESLTARGWLEQQALQWQDWIASDSLSPEQQEKLANVTQARSDILNNVNFTIKAITGAAMTEAEAKRIGATLPTVKDSPTVFKAKLAGATRRTRMAIARYNVWRNGGMQGRPEDFDTLNRVEDRVESRRAELKSKVQAGEMTLDEASAAFFAEFGI